MAKKDDGQGDQEGQEERAVDAASRPERVAPDPALGRGAARQRAIRAGSRSTTPSAQSLFRPVSGSRSERGRAPPWMSPVPGNGLGGGQPASMSIALRVVGGSRMGTGRSRVMSRGRRAVPRR